MVRRVKRLGSYHEEYKLLRYRDFSDECRWDHSKGRFFEVGRLVSQSIDSRL